MQTYTAQIGCSISVDAENMTDAHNAISRMITDGFGPTLGNHNIQVYGPNPYGEGLMGLQAQKATVGQEYRNKA